MREYADSFEWNSFKVHNVTEDEFIAYVVNKATKAITKYKLEHKPVFLWRQIPDTGDEMLGWYAGPPSALQRRKEVEGWKDVDMEAFGRGKIVPIL